MKHIFFVNTRVTICKYLLLISFMVVLLQSCGGSVDKLYSVAQIKTSKGEILFWMYDETPEHKKSFIKLAKEGLWDGSSFNRVVNNFVVQGGCPDTPAGFSDSPYLLKPEFCDSLTHVYGAVGAGRDENPEKLSAGCQFYIVQKREGTHFLDKRYTIFGQVVKGMDVVESIASVKVDSTDAPLDVINMDVNIITMTTAQLKKVGFTVVE